MTRRYRLRFRGLYVASIHGTGVIGTPIVRYARVWRTSAGALRYVERQRARWLEETGVEPPDLDEIEVEAYYVLDDAITREILADLGGHS